MSKEEITWMSSHLFKMSKNPTSTFVKVSIDDLGVVEAEHLRS
jgi:hypothetical protein